MGNLDLSGKLKLAGAPELNLVGDGGKVTIDGTEVLVEDGGEGTAPPVILPPPPGSPIDTGTKVEVISSFNKTVKADGNNIVAMGIVMQGDNPTWPGMMLPSSNNSTGPEINGMQVNVKNDQAIIFPSGGSATMSTSGQ